MNTIQRWMAIVLSAACLMSAPHSKAELAPDRAAFYQARAQEWEAALGDYVQWNYYERAMFCTIYGRRPGDYLNDEGTHDVIPKFPTDDCIPYEEALKIAKAFLFDYDPRITEAYLSGLHTGSFYYDFWDDTASTVTGAAHAQVWVIQFGEEHDAGGYMIRCAAYIDAVTGRVASIDIGRDMIHPDDWDQYHIIHFDSLQN